MPFNKTNVCKLICLQTRLYDWAELKHLRFNRGEILKANEISLSIAHCYYSIEKKTDPICLESFEYNCIILFSVSRYHFLETTKFHMERSHILYHI